MKNSFLVSALISIPTHLDFRFSRNSSSFLECWEMLRCEQSNNSLAVTFKYRIACSICAVDFVTKTNFLKSHFAISVSIY